MPILKDPEKNEIKAILNIYDGWAEKSVLEIGSGDGRLTWRYADKVGRILALEPSEEAHAQAMNDRPHKMRYVELYNLGFEQFASQNKERFDIALLSWSL